MIAPRPAAAGRPPRGSRKVAKPHFIERSRRTQRAAALGYRRQPIAGQRATDNKKPPEGGFSDSAGPNYLLAAIAAAPAAADAAASATPVAAAVAAEAAESATEEAAAFTAEAPAAAGGATVTATSAFLPQAVRAAAAIRVANRSDLFICILIKKCRSTKPVGNPTHPTHWVQCCRCVQKPDP